MPSRLIRLCVSTLLVFTVLFGGAVASAQEPSRQALARDLARVLIDDQMRQALSDQVGIIMLRLLGANLQERLNRRLQEGEVRTLADIVRGFVSRTLTAERIDEIAAGSYASHFDEAELKVLLDFQRSAVGRKAARLTPVIGLETAQAIESEIRESSAMPRLIEELQREFPVLRSPQTP
jgi:hypothetical protein